MTENSKINELKDEKQRELYSFRYLLGEMGIQMLVAIFRGAYSKESIMMLSGVPMNCVIGRIPVLINLNLISAMQEEFRITKKGVEFLSLIS